LAATVFAGLLITGTLTAKDPLPTGAGATQLTADMTYLKAGLEKKEEKAADPLKAVAMLIAMNAQNQMDGKDGEKMAGVRDQALKIAGALSKQGGADWDAAVKELAAMKDAKGDAKKTVKLHEQHAFDIHELMSIFKKKNKGGRGLEDDIREMANKPSDAKRVAEAGTLVALIGQYAEAMDGEADTADKKKKWTEWSKEMQKVGKEALEEALKGDKADKAAMVKKVKAIDANCTACHNVFKH
jgi:hypothetical protein